uniref:Uncharacterized protein n=1 Tax=Rhizophora mucronata TaxID=61149 RepID=A0A2P2N7P3_RHIMU
MTVPTNPQILNYPYTLYFAVSCYPKSNSKLFAMHRC